MHTSLCTTFNPMEDWSSSKASKEDPEMARARGNDFYLALLNIPNALQKGHNTSLAQRMISISTRMTLPVSASLLKPHMVQTFLESILWRQPNQQKYYDKGSEALQQLHKGQRFWTDRWVVKQVHCTTPFLWTTGRWQGVRLKMQAFVKVWCKGWCQTGCRTTRGYRRNARREEIISPESHQEEGEPKPEHGATGTLTTDENKEYWTCSRQVSVKPARFDDFVID